MLLVTGGSQGALAINRAVAGWLEAGGPTGACVIWVTGRGTYEEFRRFHQPPRVQVIDYLDPMADGYAVADLVISRAGMMTVAELCAWGLASVLIPLADRGRGPSNPQRAGTGGGGRVGPSVADRAHTAAARRSGRGSSVGGWYTSGDGKTG